MSKKKIILGPSSFSEVNKEPLNLLLKSGFELISNPYKRKITAEELRQMISDDVIGIVAGLEPLNKSTLDQSKIRVISRVGSGISNLDTEFLNKKKIKYFSTPNGPINSVAELTVGSIISLLRHTHVMNNNLHNKKWERIIGTELGGKNIAIFGYGRIGKRVAEILQFLNANIYIIDPNINEVDANMKLVYKDEAISKADIITIHTSGEDQILDENDFINIKKGAYLCNPSRGNSVSEKGLIEAIKSNRIIGAWIDTFNEEPYSGNLINFKQVILSPHIGSYTSECRYNMELQAVNNMLNCLKDGI